MLYILFKLMLFQACNIASLNVNLNMKWFRCGPACLHVQGLMKEQWFLKHTHTYIHTLVYSVMKYILWKLYCFCVLAFLKRLFHFANLPNDFSKKLIFKSLCFAKSLSVKFACFKCWNCRKQFEKRLYF